MLIPVSGHIKGGPSFNISQLRVSDPDPVSSKSVTGGPRLHCYSSLVHITMVNGNLNSSPTEHCLVFCLCLLDILCHNIYIGLGLPYWVWMQLLCPVCLWLARAFQPLPSSQMHSHASLTPVWSAAARAPETPLIFWAPSSPFSLRETRVSNTKKSDFLKTSHLALIIWGLLWKLVACD